jgi:predicted PurR-regulated permease PerM
MDPARLRIDDQASLITGNFDSVGQLASNTVTTLGHSGRMVFTLVITLLLVPVITFYWLRDWDLFKARIASLLPRDQAPAITAVLHDCETVLAAFFRGQLLVMVSLAFIYGIGLSLVGLEGGLAIGIIAGLLGFVPYLGITTGVILALLSAVLQSGDSWLPLYVVIVFGVGQAMESFVLTPRLVGERIGMSPLTVIFALLAFGHLFGFVGVLIALPVSAVLVVAVRRVREVYLESELFIG